MSGSKVKQVEIPICAGLTDDKVKQVEIPICAGLTDDTFHPARHRKISTTIGNDMMIAVFTLCTA